MKKLLAAALLASTAFVPFGAEAAFINGSVSFSGGLNGTLASSTIVSALSAIDPTSGAVNSPTGVYVGATSVTAAPFSIIAPGGVIYTTGPSGVSFAFTIVSISSLVSGSNTVGSLFTDSLDFQISGFVNDLGGVLDQTPFIGSFGADGSCILDGGLCLAGTESASYSVAIVSNSLLPPPPPPTNVPAPASLVLMGAALAGLGLARRRR